ncbi:DUF6789 family protein [Halobacterium litoreum]|uniref:DUF6789 family protein n=1 Tax=Halobacterium litoreum TaxID=2039234 RepID=A0ABD5NEJ5_9EURY|nr:DUF6789 family protein [Halobacterium litoreum]UHH13827.1 hypothetical protein LT972_02250 [Halobacterium litoreum]
MDPVESSLAAGAVATVAFAAALFAAGELLGGGGLFVFATLSALCELGGPQYCAPDSATSVALTLAAFALLFAVAWPLFFAAVTWGLPGQSGIAHGVAFAVVLWTGYAVTAAYGIGFGGETLAGDAPLLAATFVAYVVYGVVLGGGYDFLAHHRTLDV